MAQIAARLLAVASTAFVTAVLVSAPSPAFAAGTSSCMDQPQGRVHLPADDAYHPLAPLEWWYYTGHLQADGRRFGFELEFWASEGRLIRVDTAVTNDADKTFRFTSRDTYGAAPKPVDNGFDLSAAGARARGGDGHDRLTFQLPGYGAELELSATKRPVLHFGDGYVDATRQTGFPSDTYYYSRPRMETTGSMTIAGKRVPVEGVTWFDHQWGQMEDLFFAPALGDGWDWFGIQLDDGRDIMLYEVREPGRGPVMVGGDVTDADCNTMELSPDDFSYKATGSWTRPDGSCTYKLGWTLNLRDETFTLAPTVLDQEVRSRFDPYWEGDTDVAGSASGKAYSELLGYCRTGFFDQTS